MRLLLVEDDHHLAETISGQLKLSFTVDVAHTFHEALWFLRTYTYYCLIIDWSLPDGEGIELCRRARADGLDTPILLLTAKHEVQDKLTGLNSGADDYLTKPFHREELRARIKALLRRSQNFASNEQVLKHGPLTINLDHHTLYYQDQPIDLSRKEYLILELLLRHQSRVVTKDKIWEQVWEYNSLTSANTIEVHINNLRRKLDRQFGLKLIHTVRGLGYKLQLEATSP